MKKVISVLTAIVLFFVVIGATDTFAQGTYDCEWTNAGCIVSFTNYQCADGTNPPAGACEDANSKCQVGIDASCFWCTDMKGLACQGAIEAKGFKCSALTCVQCDPVLEPDGTCEFLSDQEETCVNFCTTNVPKGWEWDSINQKCIEIENGQFSSETDCLNNNAGMAEIPVDFPKCRFEEGRLDSDLGIPTAIGCIPIASVGTLAVFIIKWGIRFAGGVALLLIIVSAILLTTSAGDLKKVQAAKELITATLSGILLLIFSIFILRFIGVNILQIVFFGA